MSEKHVMSTGVAIVGVNGILLRLVGLAFVALDIHCKISSQLIKRRSAMHLFRQYFELHRKNYGTH